ncbi:hypothetical protein [Paenibacillus hamazuiensis]|uniref:hypothetical protein n=1 Tax=Paenibacillus hamazuiensis TaxID=2936508 RepID=UPI0020100504|nr:hypothetical protein [Paenibacillus hamazuiensis]
MAKTKTARRAKENKFVGYRTLQRAAKIMLPFYRAVAGSEAFARRWSRAVTKDDLAGMGRLLRSVSPKASGLPYGSNGIGYFVSFPIANTELQLTNGTTIPAGTVQFFFETRVHRAICRAVLPLYRELARNRAFAIAFAKAVGAEDGAVVRSMVIGLVKTPALISVEVGVEQGGVALAFKYKFSKYVYRNLLFLERV